MWQRAFFFYAACRGVPVNFQVTVADGSTENQWLSTVIANGLVLRMVTESPTFIWLRLMCEPALMDLS